MTNDELEARCADLEKKLADAREMIADFEDAIPLETYRRVMAKWMGRSLPGSARPDGVSGPTKRGG